MSNQDPRATPPLRFRVLVISLLAVAWFCWFSAGTTWRLGAFIGEDDVMHCSLMAADNSPSDVGDARRSLVPFGVTCKLTDAQQHTSLDAPSTPGQALLVQGVELLAGIGLLLGIRALPPHERRGIAAYVGAFCRLCGVPLGLLLGAILWVSLVNVDGATEGVLSGFAFAAAAAITVAGIALRRWSMGPTAGEAAATRASSEG